MKWKKQTPTHLQPQHTSAAWTKVILALQSALTKTIFCASSLNIPIRLRSITSRHNIKGLRSREACDY